MLLDDDFQRPASGSKLAARRQIGGGIGGTSSSGKGSPGAKPSPGVERPGGSLHGRPAAKQEQQAQGAAGQGRGGGGARSAAGSSTALSGGSTGTTQIGKPGRRACRCWLPELPLTVRPAVAEH